MGIKPLSLDLFLQFQQLLVEESGLYFDEHRLLALAEKLSERLVACDFKNYEDYYRYLKFNPKRRLEFKSLIDILTVGETFFFRNEAQFEVLRNFAIPRILQRESRRVIPQIQIWCAGCSTGEEPYSLAILLREFLPNFERWAVSLLATDINRNSLKSCRAGIYGSRTIQTVPPAYLEKYFVCHGQKYILSEEIKKMVKFEHHNLARDPYTLPGMQKVDIIFCRNVTIYFDMTTLKRVMLQFAQSLSEEGLLFIGHSETLWGISDDFVPIEFPQTFLYQKRGEKEAKHAFPLSIPLPVPEAPPPLIPPPSRGRGRGEGALEEKEEKEKSPAGSLLEQGMKLANEGKYPKALSLFQEMAAHDNLCLEAHYLIGILLTKMERHNEAIEPFRRVLYIDPEQAMSYFHLANIYRFLGKREKAKKEYEHCLEFLEGKPDEEPVPFSDGLTVGVLFQAAHRSLESLMI